MILRRCHCCESMMVPTSQSKASGILSSVEYTCQTCRKTAILPEPTSKIAIGLAGALLIAAAVYTNGGWYGLLGVCLIAVPIWVDKRNPVIEESAT